MNAKWADNDSKIHFTAMRNSAWKRFSINPDGTNLKEFNQEADITTRSSSASDLVVEWEKNGSTLYRIDEQGNKIKVFNTGLSVLGPDFSARPGGASWSPDKKYILFDVGQSLYVADIQGINVAKITQGYQADWKY